MGSKPEGMFWGGGPPCEEALRFPRFHINHSPWLITVIPKNMEESICFDHKVLRCDHFLFSFPFLKKGKCSPATPQQLCFQPDEPRLPPYPLCRHLPLTRWAGDNRSPLPTPSLRDPPIARVRCVCSLCKRGEGRFSVYGFVLASYQSGPSNASLLT